MVKQRIFTMKWNTFWLAAGSTLCVVFPASAITRYVNLNNSAPAAPYLTWAAAATNMQDAVDVATAGDDILVTNGVYRTGAVAVYGMSNRLAVTKPVTVRSVNGPGVTTIAGYGPVGPAAVRCVYLTRGAVLAGFTLTNGATQSSGDLLQQQTGGGVWCEDWSGVVSNCVVTGNSALSRGGGAYHGTLDHCTLTGNSAPYGGGANNCTLNNCTLTGNSGDAGGGAYSGILNNCTLRDNSAAGSSALGGGAYYATLNNCTLTDNVANEEGGGACAGKLNNCMLARNSAMWGGGGAASSQLTNCTLTGNSASFGGAAYHGTLNNCTLTGNSASSAGGGAVGDGHYPCTLNNCIVYFNSALINDNYYSTCAFNNCCTTPLPAGGTGNFTNAPNFLDPNGWANLRLQANSPCIGAGNNAYAPEPVDLDGRPRVVGGTADVGAYEFQPGVSGGFLGWLEGYGLPRDGSADFADSDNDGLNNWQEWIIGTDPTNFGSGLRLAAPAVAVGGVTLTWASVTNQRYCVERATNLGGPEAFSLLQTNLAGWAGTTSYTDTVPPATGPAYYRIGVQQ